MRPNVCSLAPVDPMSVPLPTGAREQTCSRIRVERDLRRAGQGLGWGVSTLKY